MIYESSSFPFIFLCNFFLPNLCCARTINYTLQLQCLHTVVFAHLSTVTMDSINVVLRVTYSWATELVFGMRDRDKSVIHEVLFTGQDLDLLATKSHPQDLQCLLFEELPLSSFPLTVARFSFLCLRSAILTEGKRWLIWFSLIFLWWLVILSTLSWTCWSAIYLSWTMSNAMSFLFALAIV